MGGGSLVLRDLEGLVDAYDLFGAGLEAVFVELLSLHTLTLLLVHGLCS